MQNYGENKEIRSVFLKLYIFFKKIYTHTNFKKIKKNQKQAYYFQNCHHFLGFKAIMPPSYLGREGGM
jgi:hypothetical protein